MAPLADGPASAGLSLLRGVDAVTFLSVRSITWFFTVQSITGPGTVRFGL
jgi:hypothetical protein